MSYHSHLAGRRRRVQVYQAQRHREQSGTAAAPVRLSTAGTPRVIRHKIDRSTSRGSSQPAAAPSTRGLPAWLPERKPVLEEASGALIAAFVVYVVALIFGYVRGPDGGALLTITGIALLLLTTILGADGGSSFFKRLTKSRYEAIRKFGQAEPLWFALPLLLLPLWGGMFLTVFGLGYNNAQVFRKLNPIFDWIRGHGIILGFWVSAILVICLVITGVARRKKPDSFNGPPFMWSD